MATKKNAEVQEEAQVQEMAAQPAVKMVKIRIPKTREEKSPVFVSVNDYTCLIQRGVEVEVPEAVAEVLRHQEEMLETIMSFEQKNGK